MVVNFFTPWCHWCQRLEPVWEKSNAEFVKNHAGDKRLVLAKVDCTADNSDELCTKNRIDAFPTIMVFRRVRSLSLSLVSSLSLSLASQTCFCLIISFLLMDDSG